MEKIVKQIQLLTLIIILISTVIAIGSELYQMFKIQTVTLADLLLLFLYLEVLAMVRVFWESQSIQITLPLFIAITALSRFIILQGKSINPEILVYEAGALYGFSSIVLGGIFLYLAWSVWRHGDEEEKLESHKSAKRLFGFSIFYLFALLAVLMIDRVYLFTDHSVLLRI